MPSLSRRALLQNSIGIVSSGLSGCLGFPKSYPPTGLLIVNADETRRIVTVRVTDTEGTTLFEDSYTVPADGRREQETIVTTGPIRVATYVGEKPATVRDECFDFSGCGQARPVITVERGEVQRIGKQDTCRPTESTYT